MLRKFLVIFDPVAPIVCVNREMYTLIQMLFQLVLSTNVFTNLFLYIIQTDILIQSSNEYNAGLEIRKNIVDGHSHIHNFRTGWPVDASVGDAIVIMRCFAVASIVWQWSEPSIGLELQAHWFHRASWPRKRRIDRKKSNQNMHFISVDKGNRSTHKSNTIF